MFLNILPFFPVTRSQTKSPSATLKPCPPATGAGAGARGAVRGEVQRHPDGFAAAAPAGLGGSGAVPAGRPGGGDHPSARWGQGGLV